MSWLNTVAIVAAVIAGVGGMFTGLAALFRSRTDAAVAVSRAAVALLDPTREQVDYLRRELGQALTEIQTLRRQMTALDDKLRDAYRRLGEQYD